MKNKITDELSRIDPLKFQELCATLLSRTFPTLRAVDGTGGDEGVDAWIPETHTYFQFHAPRARVPRRKVHRYLQQAAKLNPAKWIFITNRDFTRAQWRWFDELGRTVNFPIEAWGTTKLSAQLQSQQNSDLLDHYLNPEMRTLGIRVNRQEAEHITNIVNIHGRQKKNASVLIPGTVAMEPQKLGYLKHLAKRYIQFKEWDVGKPQMRYALIYTAYRRELRYSLTQTPLDKFEEACRFFQRRIENTKIGRTKKGSKLYPTFQEFIEEGSSQDST